MSRKLPFVAFAFSLMAATAAHPATPTVLDGLSGNWAGKGKAYVTQFGNVSAKCRFSVSEASSTVVMDGSCGLGPIKQKLGLRLEARDNGRVTGTYTGSKTGPAKLSGTIKGDRLIMAITWNKPVNGDREAQMVLQRTGSNAFSQTVTDTVDGKTVKTSNFAFNRR